MSAGAGVRGVWGKVLWGTQSWGDSQKGNTAGLPPHRPLTGPGLAESPWSD